MQNLHNLRPDFNQPRHDIDAEIGEERLDALEAEHLNEEALEHTAGHLVIDLFDPRAGQGPLPFPSSTSSGRTGGRHTDASE